MIYGVSGANVRFSSYLQGVYGAQRVGRTDVAAPSSVTSPAETYRNAVDLRHALEELQRVLGTRRTNRADEIAVSGAPLGLDTLGAYTRFESIEEVNATPTSYSPFGPDWAKGSTALPTLDGVYTGTTDDTLTFKAKAAGELGDLKKALNIDVRDSAGNKIDKLTIKPSDQPGDVYTLKNGLEVSFAAGTIDKKDTFEVQVWASVGSVVDPDKPFDGVRNDRPNLEYGLSVTDGSFQVNGTTIAVSASDTLRDVVDRITAQVDDVTAVFDAATETVRLTRDTIGALDILVEGDTSGFVAASKMSTAGQVLGHLPDKERPLEEVGAFSSMQTGTFYLNDVAFQIDVKNDTLEDVIARINASYAGVAAALVDGGQRVQLTATDRDKLIVHSGDSGFFQTLGIADGTYRNEERRGLPVRSVSRAMEDVAKAFNTLYGPPTARVGLGSTEQALLDDLKGAVQTAMGSESDRLRTRFGFTFDFRADARDVFDLSSRGEQQLRRVLRNGPRGFKQLFAGTHGGSGETLLERMIGTLKVAEGRLAEDAGGRGLLLHTVA